MVTEHDGFWSIKLLYLITNLKIGLNELMVLIKRLDLVVALLARASDFRFVYTANALGGPRQLCTDMIPAWAVFFGDHLQLMG